MPDELAERREQREAATMDQESTNQACIKCGSEWWLAKVVIRKGQASVCGWAPQVACAECGEIDVMR